MRLLLLCLMLLFSGIAVGGSPSPRAGDNPLAVRESSVWQSVKDQKFEQFANFLDPGYAGVYADGLHSRDVEAAAVRREILRAFTISDFSARTLDARIRLVTYKIAIQGSFDGADISGVFWASSVWRKVNGHWLLQLHSETKAE